MKSFKKFIYDITRDSGSTKTSITKTLALLSFMFLMCYLTFYLFIIRETTELYLVAELMGMTLTLLGFKNNWGVKKRNSSDSSVAKNKTIVPPVMDKDDEGSF